MDRCLVVYGSKYGSTREVAEAIAEGLGADVENVEDHPDLGGVDLVVIGSPIYAGDYLGSVVDYVRKSRASLSSLDVAAFITAAADWEAQAGLTGDDRDMIVTQQDYADGLAELTGGRVVATKGFGGRLDPKQLDEQDRAMLEWFYRFLMHDDLNGFDLLDLPAAREWGTALRSEIEKERP